QWLLKVVSPFLDAWPDVDVDVKQKFQFGGVGALLDYEIDLLVTPDPFYKSGLNFQPVFDYEQVLVVPQHHPLTAVEYARAEDLRDQVLLTYPVPTRSEEHTSELQSRENLVCRLLLEKKK